EEEPRRDGTREPDTLSAPDPLLHAGRAVLSGSEPASLAVRGLGILHQGLAVVLPPCVAADAHHHDKQNDRTDHDHSDFQPGRHELPARFSIASFYAGNMIRVACSVIARRTREPAREQRGTSRWQAPGSRVHRLLWCGRGLLLARSSRPGMSAPRPL